MREMKKKTSNIRLGLPGLNPASILEKVRIVQGTATVNIKDNINQIIQALFF